MSMRSLSALLIISIVTCGSCLDFPVAPYGHCYEGVQILESYFYSQGLPTQIAYTYYISDQYPGHVWLIVGPGPDFEFYDSYYGKIDREGEYGFPKWYYPDKIFNSTQKMNEWRQDAAINGKLGGEEISTDGYK
jgi:hypothetical protein